METIHDGMTVLLEAEYGSLYSRMIFLGMRSTQIRGTIARKCQALSYVVDHGRKNKSLGSLYRVYFVSKRLRLIICVSYSWEGALDVILGVSFYCIMCTHGKEYGRKKGKLIKKW
jgi:hypothetical protein